MYDSHGSGMHNEALVSASTSGTRQHWRPLTLPLWAATAAMKPSLPITSLARKAKVASCELSCPSSLCAAALTHANVAPCTASERHRPLVTKDRQKAQDGPCSRGKAAENRPLSHSSCRSCLRALLLLFQEGLDSSIPESGPYGPLQLLMPLHCSMDDDLHGRPAKQAPETQPGCLPAHHGTSRSSKAT